LASKDRDEDSLRAVVANYHKYRGVADARAAAMERRIAAAEARAAAAEARAEDAERQGAAAPPRADYLAAARVDYLRDRLRRLTKLAACARCDGAPLARCAECGDALSAEENRECHQGSRLHYCSQCRNAATAKGYSLCGSVCAATSAIN